MEQLGADPVRPGQRPGNCSPITSSAIDSPPEADPVIPARTLTATASETSRISGSRRRPLAGSSGSPAWP